MGATVNTASRISVDGKFLRLSGKKFYARGVTYGPFAPNTSGDCFANLAQTKRDLALIQELGANVLRVYNVPPHWFLDLVLAHDLRLLVDVPWNKHLCFLDSEASSGEAMEAVRNAAKACGNHTAVMAISVLNEPPADIVRWSGAKQMAHFIERAVEEVKLIAPQCLCTFSNYPPTEYLRPLNIDFHCFNVYLHQQKPFDNYLARLQMIADGKPLVLGEFGIDSLREGEESQEEILNWQIETAFRGGVAGTFVYSFTDDWFKDGRQIRDWAFGLTTTERQAKLAFATVRRLYRIAPHFPLFSYPKVSIVVASYNGERTLDSCLKSLQHLNYPAYEVLLVDDGSTDSTESIARRYPEVQYIKHEQNQGLSVARNTGIAAATGEIVAFTDSDCRADEDWLHYLIGDLLNSPFTGIGGHNLLPTEDSWVAACVMASPGGPAHVMITDRLAEHIPGCNMAFYKWALDDIGGFDPLFRKAGDDVDVCWRLQQQGYQLGFSPGGFVWHYRRATTRDYIKQQLGYGEAEALLTHRHPEYFNWVGGSQWQGRIYSSGKFGVLLRSPIIYHGWFGAGFFQTLYSPTPSFTLMLVTSFEYHILITLPLVVLAALFRNLIPTTIASILLPMAVCIAAAWQSEIPKNQRRTGSRLLVAFLFFLQPIVRGWARYKRSLNVPRSRLTRRENLESALREDSGLSFREVEYWNDPGLDRLEFLGVVLERLDQRGWQHKIDTGWNQFDVEIFGSAFTHLQLTTVSEFLSQGKQLIRCRLQTEWTLFAKVLFFALLGLEIVIIGLVGSDTWWHWLILLTLPLMVWFLHKDQNKLRRLVSVFLDEVATDLKLKRMESEKPRKTSP